jgi:hypothetical protein
VLRIFGTEGHVRSHVKVRLHAFEVRKNAHNGWDVHLYLYRCIGVRMGVAEFRGGSCAFLIGVSDESFESCVLDIV